MNFFQAIIAFFGRLCLSLIFISAGVQKMMDWPGAKQALMNALCDLQAIVVGVEWAQPLLDMGFNFISQLMVVAAGFELLGGLMILLGVKVRFGAFLLILFLIPTTLLFHGFWFMQGTDRELQMVMFMKNLSIFGGLLILLAYGKGVKSKQSKDSSVDKT